MMNLTSEQVIEPQATTPSQLRFLQSPERMAAELVAPTLPTGTQKLLKQIRFTVSREFPDSTPLDFSVAICTYNGEQRLPLLLECLRWQLNTHGLAWEVIVVDNNSQDNTATVVSSFQQDWPSKVPLRYCFEPRQGAAFARQRAIKTAHSPLVGFLDDDNSPSMLWVAAAYRFGHIHLQAGAYGSRIQGDFNQPPPAQFERIAALLALTERGDRPLRYEPHKKVLPPGAGLVVRRESWLTAVPDTLLLAAKIGTREAGEDLEVVLHIQRKGWEVWYNPAMRLKHRIPNSRLQREYLMKLCRGIGLSRHGTRMLSFPAWQRPWVVPLYALNDLRRIVRHLLKYKHHVLANTVTACELTLYVYSLISPLYFAKRAVDHYRQQTIQQNP